MVSGASKRNLIFVNHDGNIHDIVDFLTVRYFVCYSSACFEILMFLSYLLDIAIWRFAKK